MESDEGYVRAEEMKHSDSLMWESLNQDLGAIRERLEGTVMTFGSCFDVDKIMEVNKAVLGIHTAQMVIESVFLSKEATNEDR